VYLERLRRSEPHALLHSEGWQLTFLVLLVIAAKVWDSDYPISNADICAPASLPPPVDQPHAKPLSTRRVNDCERRVLQMLDYGTLVSPAEFARVYLTLPFAFPDRAGRSRVGGDTGTGGGIGVPRSATALVPATSSSGCVAGSPLDGVHGVHSPDRPSLGPAANLRDSLNAPSASSVSAPSSRTITPVSPLHPICSSPSLPCMPPPQPKPQHEVQQPRRTQPSPQPQRPQTQRREARPTSSPELTEGYELRRGYMSRPPSLQVAPRSLMDAFDFDMRVDIRLDGQGDACSPVLTRPQPAMAVSVSSG
jgi:hypothetical protein